MFDPTVGRWIQVDPIGFEAEDMNLYRYVGNNPTNHRDPTGLIETDDNPNNPGIRALGNADKMLNAIVTKVVRAALRKYSDKKQMEVGIEMVFTHLGKDFPGSGGLATMIEQQLKKDLKKDAKDKVQLIYQVKGEDSRFSKVPLDFNAPVHMFKAKFIRDLSLSPVIKIDGIPVGIDKIGHFFQQGYWYFKIFGKDQKQNQARRENYGLWLEGDPAYTAKAGKEELALWPKLTKEKVKEKSSPLTGDKPGRHGWPVSGIVSYADLAANQAGYDFYADLANNWGMYAMNPGNYNFDIQKHLKQLKQGLKSLNEYHNPNKFHPYLKDVTGPKAK